MGTYFPLPRRIPPNRRVVILRQLACVPEPPGGFVAVIEDRVPTPTVIEEVVLGTRGVRGRVIHALAFPSGQRRHAVGLFPQRHLRRQRPWPGARHRCAGADRAVHQRTDQLAQRAHERLCGTGAVAQVQRLDGVEHRKQAARQTDRQHDPDRQHHGQHVEGHGGDVQAGFDVDLPGALRLRGGVVDHAVRFSLISLLEEVVGNPAQAHHRHVAAAPEHGADVRLEGPFHAPQQVGAPAAVDDEVAHQAVFGVLVEHATVGRLRGVHNDRADPGGGRAEQQYPAHALTAQFQVLHENPMPVDALAPITVDGGIEHRPHPIEATVQAVREEVAVDLGLDGVETQLPPHDLAIGVFLRERSRRGDKAVLQKGVVALSDIDRAHQILDLLQGQPVIGRGRLQIFGEQCFIRLFARVFTEPGKVREVEIQPAEILQGQLGQRAASLPEQRCTGLARRRSRRARNHDSRRHERFFGVYADSVGVDVQCIVSLEANAQLLVGVCQQRRFITELRQRRQALGVRQARQQLVIIGHRGAPRLFIGGGCVMQKGSELRLPALDFAAPQHPAGTEKASGVRDPVQHLRQLGHFDGVDR